MIICIDYISQLNNIVAMTLDQYRIEKGWSFTRLAKMLGASDAKVASRWCKGEQIPNREFMAAIMNLTQGAVSPNDFYKHD
tara:strand:- start:741 stop:983 length:243 start_codon:yes stop_codon:yes gene_type:complete